ncbi:hypothetical protein GYMLUDRAFT_253693 [Collybiopsis luxurians FD-317 M1]|uniref:Uncharacterized protein n=1 Tax=Collybiopsis luxurians FD-317 M1 TaxID=944289 RepID=A0A0D0AHU8_9AGAR|nr:hypothetical protein GYMLUDRAFT_253693 [Collybiopsis luxurians FD-317 M1]
MPRTRKSQVVEYSDDDDIPKQPVKKLKSQTDNSSWTAFGSTVKSRRIHQVNFGGDSDSDNPLLPPESLPVLDPVVSAEWEAGIEIKIRAKRYASSDAPLLGWIVQYRNSYLDSHISYDGHGRIWLLRKGLCALPRAANLVYSALIDRCLFILSR